MISCPVWPWNLADELEKNRTPFHATPSSVHHFVAIGEFKLELQSGNAQFGSKSAFFLAIWPWNLMDDLEKQWGTSPMPNQDLCIISSPYVTSNWSYSPETTKLGFDLCDLDLWPLMIEDLHEASSWWSEYFMLCSIFSVNLKLISWNL